MTKVLIVDDKPENLRYLETLLGKHDFAVECARNGAEALASAQQTLPNLIISDLLMPVMDGYTLLKHWKSDTALKHIPFIVYTATFTDLDDRRFGESLGADAYVLKHAGNSQLLGTVRRVLAKASVTAPSLPHAGTPDDADKTTLRYYSERLIGKLEEKSLQLEQTNQALQQEIKEHRHADEQLRFNNAILQTQQQNTLDAILVVSVDGKVLSFNNQFLELWGVERDLLETCRATPLLQSAPVMAAIGCSLENPAAYLEKLHYVRQHNRETSLEEVRFRNGKILEVYSAPAISADALHYGRIWYYRDVTENRRAKASLEASVLEQRQLLEQLARSAALLRMAGRVLKMGGWSVDVKLGSVSWSDEVCLLHDLPEGYRPTLEEAFGYYPEDFRERLTEVFEKCRQRGISFDIESQLITARGRRIWVRVIGEALGSEEQGTRQIQGAIQDISEQKAAQEEIHGLGNRLIETLENISGGFITVDRDWNFVYVNGRAERLLKRDRTQLLGRNFWDEFKEAVGTPFQSNYERVLAEQVSVAFEEFYAPLNAWFEINAYPAHNGMAIYFRDVTARKETEAQLAYLHRVRAVLSGINALVARVDNREELFREACRVAYKAGEFRMVMLCMVDPVTGKIEPVASEGKEEALMGIIRSTLASADTASKTMVMHALRTRQPVVCNDSARDERVLFGEQYRASGVQSMAVLPLTIQDKVIGVLSLYAREIGFFQNDEMSLLGEMAGDIAFAVDHIEKLERLDYLANFDTLTGLANRELFLQRLRQRMQLAAGTGAKLCVALTNLARFKNINDTLGRANGDVLLRLVAEWLIRNTGDADQLARIGADEFAVVFDIKPEGDLIKLFEALNRNLEANSFAVNDTTLRIAARSGIAVFPDDDTDADALLRNAEAALKEARATNARFKFYTREMNVTVASRLMLENQLRNAIGNEEFELYYQPKVNLMSGKITGAEALIRWNAPHGELVLPGKFIPVLEETGMIADVGHWALRTAIADFLRWQQLGLPAVRIAVNVSPLQLAHRNFIADLQHNSGLDALAATGLELEITESVIMDNIQANTAILKAIRAMGITVAIDDFGTGFSSLGYLARLPVDALKIDRSFIVDMTSGPEGLALVSTIIGLAHALNLKVVAEGVETDEQLRLLRLLKCDEVQGYALSRPVPVAEFEKNFLLPNFKLKI